MFVPAYRTWPTRGLSGKIGRGPLGGMWVLAEQSLEVDGPQGYRLWLPEPDVYDPDTGDHLSVSMREGDSADQDMSFIHHLTKVLDVSWSLSPEDSETARTWLEEQFKFDVSEAPEKLQKYLRRLGF